MTGSPWNACFGPLVILTASVFSTASAAQPASSTPLAQARALISDGNFVEAEISLRAYLVNDPQSPPAHYLLAYSLLRQNKPKESLAEYTRAAALQTPSADELRGVGQDYVLLGDFDDASKWLARSVEIAPQDPEGWYSLGRLRYTQQRYVDAAACFEHALRLAPSSVKIENNLGLAYEGLNRTEDAIAAYRRAIILQNTGNSDHPSEQPLLNLAIVLLHRSSTSEALTFLLQAETIAPDDPRIQEQLGQVYMQQANFPEASKHLEAATRLDPEKSNLHFLLGQAYRRLGRAADSKVQFDLAARLALPNSAR